MKRKIILAVLTLGLMASATAVVYENGSSPSKNLGDDEMAITSASGSAASSTSAVGPNGTEYSITITPAGQSSNITEGRVFNVSTTSESASFSGELVSPTPCHTLNHEVEDKGYALDLRISLDASNQTCTQQMVMKEYDAEFESENYSEINVYHGDSNQSVEKITLDQGEEKKNEETENERSGILGWVLGFFF